MIIKKKALIEMGYESENGKRFDYDVFHVEFVEERDNPIVWIDDKLNEGSNVAFPGLYAIKDLSDLMFFYYGENEYTQRFGHLPTRIIE